MRLRSSVIQAFGACAIAAAMALPTTAPAAEKNWNFYTYQPNETVVSVVGIKEMLDQLNAELGDKLQIKFFLGGSLPISGNSVTQAVADDSVQFAEDGYFSGTVPVGGLLRVPALLHSREQEHAAAEIVRPFIEAAYEEKGILVLGGYEYPPFTIWSGGKQIQSLADLKGMKVRVSSPEHAEFVKRVGGVPVTLPGGEVPTALQQGLIEAAITSTVGGAWDWRDLLKYGYNLSVGYFDAYLIVNKEEFEALPADVQEVLKKRVAETMPKLTDGLFNAVGTTRAKLEAQGIVITEPTQEDIDALGPMMESFWGQWAEERGPEAVEALKQVRALN